MALCYHDGFQFIIVLAINISIEWHDFNFWHLWNYAEDGVGGNRCSLRCQLNQLCAFAGIILLIITLSQCCSDSNRKIQRKREKNCEQTYNTIRPPTNSLELARCSDLHSKIMDIKSNAPYCAHTACLRMLCNVSVCVVLCHLLIHIYFMVKIIEVFRFH